MNDNPIHARIRNATPDELDAITLAIQYAVETVLDDGVSPDQPKAIQDTERLLIAFYNEIAS